MQQIVQPKLDQMKHRHGVELKRLGARHAAQVVQLRRKNTELIVQLEAGVRESELAKRFESERRLLSSQICGLKTEVVCMLAVGAGKCYSVCVQVDTLKRQLKAREVAMQANFARHKDDRRNLRKALRDLKDFEVVVDFLLWMPSFLMSFSVLRCADRRA